MIENRSLRQKQRVTLVVILTAMIVAAPILSQPLSLPLTSVYPSAPAADITVDTSSITTSETKGLTVDVTSSDEPFVFDVPELEESALQVNRSGDLLTQAVSDAVENMARQATAAIPVFTDTAVTAYVRTASTAVYINPDEEAPRVIALQIGDPVEVTGISPAWLRITFHEAQMFVRKSDMTLNMIFVPAEGIFYVHTTDEAELKIYAEPSRDAAMVKQMWYADRVTALETSSNWTRIVNEGGFEGYVPNDILTRDIVFVQDSSNVYATKELAVYAGPDTSTEVIKYYKKDAKIQRTGYSFDWSQVLTSEKEVGYILMDHLSENPPYVAPVYTAPKPVASVPRYDYSNASVQAVIDKAMSYVGGRYVLGGTSYAGIDCSGLTMRAYEAVGISITRSSYAYWGVGYSVPLSGIRPGDIVCYDSEYNGSIGHVAIYIGGGQVVHAMNESRGVGTGTVYFGGYRILSVRRIIG